MQAANEAPAAVPEDGAESLNPYVKAVNKV